MISQNQNKGEIKNYADLLKRRTRNNERKK